MSQQFCLKWNNHMNNMMDVFKNLLSTESMVDVTLACDGLSLKAHKMVLSACSPFFQALFLENPCQHPIVILKDMKYTELKAIIEFMYHGEVNVAQEQLSALMKTAETLRVKGLAEVTNEKGQSSQEDSGHTDTQQRRQSHTDTPPPHSKRRKVRNRKRSLSGSDYSDSNDREPKIKQPTSPDIEELSGDISMDASSGQFQNVNIQQSRVPMQSHSSNSYHKTPSVASSQDLHMEGGVSENESEFGVEPAKLLQQSLTTEDARRSRLSSNLTISEPQRRPKSSTDHSMGMSIVPTTLPSDESSQPPASPLDIKPELLELDPPMSPVAGPSHSTENAMVVYGDAGPSYQDNSALVSQDSQQGFQKRTLSMMKIMQKDIKAIKEAINRNFSVAAPIISLPSNFPELPCESPCELEALEVMLQDENRFMDMSNFVSTIGGTSEKDCTRRILSKLISNNLSMQYNWKGTRGLKLAFSAFTLLRKLILGAVKMNPSCSEATESSVDKIIKSWLMHAKDRDGGRRLRALAES